MVPQPRTGNIMNKHIVKHIVPALCPSLSGLMNKHIMARCRQACKQTDWDAWREDARVMMNVFIYSTGSVL